MTLLAGKNEPRPTDPVSPDVEWYCWSPHGWESAGEGSVRDASKTTRGQAAAFFAREIGDLRDVRVWKRYVRPLTRQDVWDDYGQDRYADRLMDEQGIEPVAVHDVDTGAVVDWAYANADTGQPVEEPHIPTEPPVDWQPDEYDPTWMFVHRSHPDAIPVWVCGCKGDEPPTNPQKDKG